MSSLPQDLTLSNVPQTLTLGNVPQNLTLSNVPQTLTLNNVPQQPQGGLSAVTPQKTPTAEQAAQHSIIMKSPNVGGFTWDAQTGQFDYTIVPTPMPTIVPTPMPQNEMPQYDMSKMPAPMFGDGPLRPTPEQLAAYNKALLQPNAIGGAWDPIEGAFRVDMAAAPRYANTQPVMPTPMPVMPEPYMPTPMPQYAAPTPMPVMPTPMPVMPEPYMPTPMPVMPTPMPSSGIGAFLGKFGEAPQGVGTPPVASQQLINALTRQPKQGSFVDTMPTITMPAPTGSQVMPPNAQGMALGGLMRKYY